LCHVVALYVTLPCSNGANESGRYRKMFLFLVFNELAFEYLVDPDKWKFFTRLKKIFFFYEHNASLVIAYVINTVLLNQLHAKMLNLGG